MRNVLFAVLILLMVLLGNWGYDQVFRQDGVVRTIREVPQEVISRENAITRAVKTAEEAVISVNVIKTEYYRQLVSPFDNPFFGYYYLPKRRDVQSFGSGVIINGDGYALTNAHVVEGATQMKVTLPDGREFDGELVGSDDVHDIAVIRVMGKDLPVAKLGISENILIGEWAIAIGNPYAFMIQDSKPSVSVGVISATDRNFTENRENKIYKHMIQTDAAINPGNSGGPLVNINGEVIGINTFIFSESGGSIGIGFAIPVDRVNKIADELIRYGKIRERMFGFRVSDIDPRMMRGSTHPDGVMVSRVEETGPAKRAGLRRGDIITAINGTKVHNVSEAEMAVSDAGIGESLKLEIMNGVGEKTLTFRIE